MVFCIKDALYELGPLDREAFKKGLGRRFMKMYADGLTELIDFKLSGHEHRTLLLLVESLDYKNIITTTREKIAGRLGVDVKNVPRYLKALRSHWLIYPVLRDDKKHPFGYIVNPRYFWVGNEGSSTSSAREKRLREIDGVPMINVALSRSDHREYN